MFLLVSFSISCNIYIRLILAYILLYHAHSHTRACMYLVSFVSMHTIHTISCMPWGFYVRISMCVHMYDSYIFVSHAYMRIWKKIHPGRLSFAIPYMYVSILYVACKHTCMHSSLSACIYIRVIDTK